MKKLLCIIILMALFCVPGHSQRVIRGQHIITVSGFGWKRLGGELGWGQCYDQGKLVFKAGCLIDRDQNYHFKADERMPEADLKFRSYDVTGSFGYLWRLLSNRHRSFNIWSGMCADLGARLYGWDDDKTGFDAPSSKFIFGVSARVELEYFVFNSTSVFLNCAPRLQFYGHKKNDTIFYPDFGIGLNFYMF